MDKENTCTLIKSKNYFGREERPASLSLNVSEIGARLFALEKCLTNRSDWEILFDNFVTSWQMHFEN